MKRRDFLKLCGGSVAAVAGAAQTHKLSAATSGANNRIRLGVIGNGGMGTRHLEALAVNPQCTVVAVCDCFKPRYENAIGVVEKLSGKAPVGYQDFRRVLERKDIDAIWVATPDHWHSLLAIMGCEAGKDVYVEKPASPTVAEGRAMVRAARRYGCVVQVGTQQRSMPVFRKAIELLHGGRIGQITSATAWIDVNGWSPGETLAPVPEGLDWDMWLGPAPWVPYSPQRHYGFMGWHDYCRGGQLTNWGIHLLDIVQWGIRQDRPLSVQCVGGSYRGGAGAENYENIETAIEYPGCIVTWEQRHHNSYHDQPYGIRFHGTDGQLLVNRTLYEVFPKSLGIPKYIGEPERSWANPDHHNNFFECVRSRQKPAADIEQGHRSTTTVLLAGIALKEKRKLNWDGQSETFIRDQQANRHLSRAYRAPWHL